MATIFDPLTINRMVIKNRFVRSATMDNLGKGGLVTEAQLNMYKELAIGEVGLIVSTGLFPVKTSQGPAGQLGCHDDSTIPSLKKIADIVHKNGGKIAAQFLHCGWYSNPEITGIPSIGPSNITNPFTGNQVRALASDEIYELIADYGKAARRVIEAGFDAIQFHAAHSWLISTFLSPVTNLRDDQWGGSPQKRPNFLIKLYEEVRRCAGKDYPVFIKFGVMDSHPQGRKLEEGIQTAETLQEKGLDAIEISEGMEFERGHHIRQNAVDPYYLDDCRAARKALSMPLIVVGGMRKLADMKAVVENNTADGISMCRPFIMDPHIVSKFIKGQADESGCTSCNGCIEHMHSGKIHCILT
jgi:2,4-dienoyl-CoA reductase-like NADH-dependent reductase (Old Yellow Enzyme family)